MTRGSKNARAIFVLAGLVVPNHFAGAVVQRAYRGVRPKIAIPSSPPFRFSRGGVIVNAEDAPRSHIEEARLRIKARRHPIRRSVRAGFHQRAVRARRGIWLGDWAAMRVQSGSPRLIDERRSGQILSVRSIQQEIKPVAAGLRQQLAFLALEFGVKQNRRLDRVPVMYVMR